MIIKSYVHQVMSRQEFDMIKITRQIFEDVADSGVQNGVVFVISLHTTTGIMINESLPCVEKDIEMAMERLMLIALPYFICGLAEVQVGCIRGMNHSIAPMIVSLMCICVFRVVWLYTFFAWEHTLFMLFLSYPASWLVAVTGHAVCRRIYLKRLLRSQPAAAEA